MIITPVFTEKSLQMSKEGKYSFWVPRTADKLSLKSEIAKIFGVHVLTIKTISVPGEAKRNAKGKKVRVLALKKAIVTLKDGEKIDLFEETKK